MTMCRYLIIFLLLVLTGCSKDSQGSCFNGSVIGSLSDTEHPESFIDGVHNDVPFILESDADSNNHQVFIVSLSSSDVNGENFTSGGRLVVFIFNGKHKRDGSNLALKLWTDVTRDSSLTTNEVMNSLMEELDRKREWGIGRKKYDNDKMAFSYSNECYNVNTWDGFPESEQYVHVDHYERIEDHDQYHYHIIFNFDVRVYVGNANYEKSHFKGIWNAKFSLDK